jgi:hypothetical protein
MAIRLSRQNRNTTMGPCGRYGIGILPAWRRWLSMSPPHCDAHVTASSTSRSVERPTRPLTTPSAGLKTSCDLPPEAATCPHPIMLGMVWIADVVTEVFIVRLRFVRVSVARR